MQQSEFAFAGRSSCGTASRDFTIFVQPDAGHQLFGPARRPSSTAICERRHASSPRVYRQTMRSRIEPMKKIAARRPGQARSILPRRGSPVESKQLDRHLSCFTNDPLRDVPKFHQKACINPKVSKTTRTFRIRRCANAQKVFSQEGFDRVPYILENLAALLPHWPTSNSAGTRLGD